MNKQNYWRPSRFDFWPVRWSASAAIVRSRIPQVVGLIPVLGYAALWGDEFQNWIMRFGSLDQNAWLAPLQRIYFLYFGSVGLLLGLLVFLVWCPASVRKSSDRREYMRHVIEEHNDGQLVRILADLSVSADLSDSGDAKTLRRNGLLFLGSVDAVQLFNGIQNLHVMRSNQISSGPYLLAALGAHYDLRNRHRPVVSLVAFSLLVGGAASFFVPSVEVFWLAVRHLVAT